MSQTNSPDRLLTRKEAAVRLGLAVVTLEAWASRGNRDLPYIRVGSKCMYAERDIERYLASHRATSATAHRAAAGGVERLAAVSA
jgi:predicted site-specific integrase-resolvase